MADHQIFGTLKQSVCVADIDPDIEFINSFSGLFPNDQAFNFHNSINTILPQLGSANLEDLHGLFVNAGDENTMLTTPPPPPPPQPIIDDKQRKRKAMDMMSSSSTSANTCSHSSPQVSDSGSGKAKNLQRGKKATKVEKKEEAREVIHVRAKRGQATDSHSLAERVRRGKINERLRCLQDIVPGCYKTMGMAVMLDEIINYVQSLQNQVEFLSMKLTAASTFHDFNAETDSMEAMQRANAFEAMKAENMANQGLPLAQFSQLGQSLGYFPQLPHSR